MYSVWASSCLEHEWQTTSGVRDLVMLKNSGLWKLRIINQKRRWAWCQKTCHYHSYSIDILLILLILPGYSYDFLEIPMISYMMSTSKIPDVSSQQRLRNNKTNNAPHRPEIPASLAWISRGCHGSFELNTPWKWIFWKWRNGPES